MPSPPPSVPTEVLAAATRAGLGDLRASFGPAKTESLTWFAVFAVVMTALTVLMAFTGSWVVILFAVLAAAALGAVVQRWRADREFRGARLDLFGSGVVVTKHAGVRVLRYADTSVSQEIVNVVWRGRYNHTTHRYTLRPVDGEPVVLQATSGRAVGGLPRPEEWGPAIQQGITDAHLPRAWDAVERGQRVRFGKFWVTADHIGAGKKSWPWSRVDEVRLNDGSVQVKSASRWMSLTDGAVSDVENFFVFLALAQRLEQRR